MPHTFHLNKLTKNLLACIMTSLFMPTLAHAFAEDLCFHYVDPQSKSGDVIPKAFNCWNVQCTDSIKPENEPAGCLVKGVARYANATMLKGLHGRNMIHFDTLYLFARLSGMSESDAFEAAAYSESTDLGIYIHNDQKGKALTSLQTDNLKGVTRLNPDTDGFSYHFVPWFRSQGHVIDKPLSYDTRYQKHQQASPFATSEAMINHLRLWSFGGRQTLCDFGLTQNQSDALSDCFSEADNKKIYVSVPIFAADCDNCRRETHIPVAWQKIVPTNSGDCGNQDGQEACVYDPDYAKKIHGTPKSLGIYLHVLGDRLSHYYCSDRAFITEGWDRKQSKPAGMDADASYSLWYNNTCGTLNHIAQHYPETGHKVLPQQTVKMLRFGYLEVQDWINQTGYFKQHPEQKPAVPNKGYPQLNETGKITALVGAALKKADAGDRNKALCEIALKGYGVTPWHDGSTDCKYPK